MKLLRFKHHGARHAGVLTSNGIAPFEEINAKYFGGMMARPALGWSHIRSRVLPACFLLLAIVFCPETYMFIGQAHIAGSFKALALSLLVILLLIYRLEEKLPQPAEAGASA